MMEGLVMTECCHCHCIGHQLRLSSYHDRNMDLGILYGLQ